MGEVGGGVDAFFSFHIGKVFFCGGRVAREGAALNWKGIKRLKGGKRL